MYERVYVAEGGVMLKSCSGGSTLIKAGRAGPILKRLSTVDLADHLGEARGILEAAKEGAARTLSEAERECARKAAEAEETARAAGYKAGFEAGKRDGHETAYEESRRKFESQHAGIVAQMQRAIAEIDEMKEGLRVAAERDLLDFALMLATKMTCSVGRLFRESAIENARRALRLVGTKTDVTIRVNPDDFTSMETYARDVLRQVDASPAVRILSDDSISAGGCIVETGSSCVDATLETQIDELTGLLLGQNDASLKPPSGADEKGEADD